MTSTTKKSVIYTIVFSALAIVFALLYYFHAIAKMDLALTFVYVAYFAGVALLYNGTYMIRRHNIKGGLTSVIAGIVSVLGSASYLIYGIVTETIVLFAK